jgi:hypothetical protein
MYNCKFEQPRRVANFDDGEADNFIPSWHPGFNHIKPEIYSPFGREVEGFNYDSHHGSLCRCLIFILIIMLIWCIATKNY